MLPTGWKRGLLAACSVAALVTACTTERSSTCGDGLLCPASLACAPERNECLAPERLQACDGLDEGEPCRYSNVPAGRCELGACVPAECGNGMLEAGEVCDDGNNASGDGCRSDCLSDESCGNGVTDVSAGEACDCGDGRAELPAGCAARNGADPICQADCTFRGCGDGVVSTPEECEPGVAIATECTDVGYYEGELACAPQCRFDTSGCEGTCGDGIVNGPEACDGDYLPATEGCFLLASDFGRAECGDSCNIDTSPCGFIGWRDEQTGARSRLYGLWGADDSRLVAVGEGGTIAIREQGSWTTLRQPFDSDLYAVDGRSNDDVVAVGEDGLVVESDGTTWKGVTPGPRVDLRGVWMGDAGLVIAVGDRGTVLRRDGGRWNATASQGDRDLYAVHAAPGADVAYIVGERGALLELRSGGTISVQTPFTESLRAVWAAPDGGLYVAGDDGLLALRRDGAWHRALRQTPSNFRDLAELADGRVAGVTDTGETVVFDGAHPQWIGRETRSSPTVGRRVFGGLYGVWSDGVRLTAVGDAGLAARFDGIGLSQTSLTPSLQAVGFFDGQPVACGSKGLVLLRSGEHWLPLESFVETDLRDIDGDFIVGYEGTLLEFDGSGLRTVEVPTEENLLGVWQSPSGTLYVVGAEMTVLRRVDGQWEAMDPPDLPSNPFFPGPPFVTEISGVSDDDFVIANSYGALRFRNGAWSPVNLPPVGPFDGIVGVRGIGAGIYIARTSDVAYVAGNSVSMQATPGNSNRALSDSQSVGTLRILGQSTLRLRNGLWVADTVPPPPFAQDIAVEGERTVAVTFSALYENADADADGSSGLVRTYFKSTGSVVSHWAPSPSAVYTASETSGVALFDGVQWRALGGSGCVKRVWTSGDEVFRLDCDDNIELLIDGAWEPQRTLDWSLAAVASSDDVTVLVGASDDAARSLVYRDGAWLEPALDASPLVDVWADGPTAIAVGAQGTVLSLHDAKWVPMPLPPTDTAEDLAAVWGASPRDVWAVGGSRVLRFDGETWRTHVPDLEFPATEYRDVFGSGPSDLFIVAARAGVQHFDGRRWAVFARSRTDTPTVFRSLLVWPRGGLDFLARTWGAR